MTNPTRASLTTRRARALRRRQGELRRRHDDTIRDLLAQVVQRAGVQLLVDGIHDLCAWIAVVDWKGVVDAIADALTGVF